ncbi:uncharacterized protein LOC125237869 [Leguminivora glycinivorella]|uniref:uncharacterized protein LOC125237869 n=1 Tax=Leguminivora glycinivorella TaxID=1035111 RepID=UPI00200C2985|nr:uncharacterized protein LOC125237869 [Leguminivora glycinivorella]
MDLSMSEMDVCDDEQLDAKKCYKCGYDLLDNLNVVYNSSSSIFIFWNKYQLFLYENMNFEDTTRIFTPEFRVQQIIISNNYLICLDCRGHVHVTSLKFKNTHKRLKTSFLPRERNILAFVECGEYVMSLKGESGTYFLCLNTINSDFQPKRKIAICYKDEIGLALKTTQDKCLLAASKITSNNEEIKRIFSVNLIEKDTHIVIMSFDRMNLFACLFSSNTVQDEIQLIKLYSCPSEICNIQIIQLEEFNLIIVLKSGTILKLSLQKTPQMVVPIHLNTAVNKFILFKDTLIYTDGLSIWKTENIFSNITFKQYFLRQVKDFVRVGDQLVCTTFSKLIYVIPDDDLSYLEPPSVHCPVEKLLNNSEYLYKLLEEVDKNNVLIEKLNEEGNYITALALSNRQDLMDNILKNTITVYEHYEDAVKENPDLTITEDLKEYFKAESVYFLVKTRIMQMENLVNQVMSQLFRNSKIHISLFSEDKLLKTNSLNLSETFYKMNVLIPLDYRSVTNMSVVKVNIKIVTHLPGAFDSKEPTWTTLYSKEIILNSEHFIKTDLISNRPRSLKEPQEKIDEMIAKIASNQHGNLFKFTDTTNPSESEFSMYVKLPVNYAEIFKNQELFNYLNTRKAEYLSKQLSSEEFLKSNSNLTFEIGRHKVDVEIVTDESPVIKVSGADIGKVMGVRNFFADLLYGDYKMTGPDVQFTDYAFYTNVENLQKTIKDRMESPTSAHLQHLAEQLQKTIGNLPI